ncbi:MAG: UDP-N-acetyl-D-glucosamine 2-epimerase, UDP-hydrolysing [Acidobacteria bacterium RIFCSPLOWO2_12_FULL_66_10]|nr:MAG: UDP-N-acetyl-D-glucosamine 2-epimerase, UDP-hydrolysing [Acidobacteria bacterium RIFCSPLOWO2_12_FULL_66_10]
MTQTRRIAVVTTSRADYGHLYWLLHDLNAHPAVDLKIVAFGPHLSPEFGRTVDEIERDGFSVDETVECLLSSDTDVGMAKTLGLATLGLADTLGRLRPHVLVVIADRYEMLAAAAVALTLRIPIAHIEGGELSEGAIDDAVRNALTKLSHLHFTTTERARNRVLAMGEEPWRVHCVGALSLDHLTRGALQSPAVVASRLQIALNTPLILVACHPETLQRNTAAYADAVFEALDRLSYQMVLCFPNADAGSRSLIDRARLFCASRLNARLVVNLPAPEYWSLLSVADILIGNSSSGVMETASLHKPAINVGIRQQGREHADNVLNVPADADAIVAAVNRALAPAFQRIVDVVENPYGDGRAAERIVRVLTTTALEQTLLFKRAAPFVLES